MKLSKIIYLLLILMMTTQAFAVDKFNTYQWNKKNVEVNNGQVDKAPWYEWWYYKVVIPETGESFFFVYGVVNPWDSNKTMKGTRSYVGMGDFKAKVQFEQHLPMKDFQAAYDRTYVEVQNNIASDKRLYADLKDSEGNKYSWDIQIEKKWSFNAEGWMMGMMLTEIEWYPAQADATCSGSVLSKGKLVKFTDAPCYQDRNWGKSFPDWWTWIVSNHFEKHPETALAIGGGRPKLRGGHSSPYAGVSIGLKHKGKTHSFRPIDLGNWVTTRVEFGKWEVTAYNPTHKVEIVATAPKDSFMDLQFMTPAGEIFHDYETLNGKVIVKLYKRSLLGWKLMDTLISNHAGIEFGSKDIQKLRTLYKQMR
jgi:tocopherol cyclase